MAKAKREKRTASDWEDAALSAIAKGGTFAVSVEAIARQLGVTKGSFYWHFADREALLRAALLRWEERYTQRVISELATVADPRERLVRLIGGSHSAGAEWRVHVALSASAQEVEVRRALARVSKRRIDYVESCYRALGFSKPAARRRAVLAYSAYLGLLHLRVEGPLELPTGRAREPYVADVLAILVPDAAP